jgi:hypothetical protein
MKEILEQPVFKITGIADIDQIDYGYDIIEMVYDHWPYALREKVSEDHWCAYVKFRGRVIRFHAEKSQHMFILCEKNKHVLTMLMLFCKLNHICTYCDGSGIVKWRNATNMFFSNNVC